MRSGRVVSIKGPSRLDGASRLMRAAVVGIAASIAICAVTVHMGRLRAEARFLQMAEQRLSAVRTNVDGALDSIALLASHFEVSCDLTSRRDFATLVAPALANHRYVQALEWIPRVWETERGAYEAAAHSDGLTDFVFQETRADGMLAVAGRRPRYFPVFYVEPRAGNERALGYDLASNPVRLAALQQARDTGRLAATARVKLVQEKANQWGTLMFAPVYDQSQPADISSRRQALRGFALSVLRIGDLVSGTNYGVRKIAAAPLVEIYLFDMTAARQERQLYPRESTATPEGLSRDLHAEHSFDVGGRRWLLLATPGPGFNDRHSRVEPLVVFVFGLLLTGLYLGYMKAKITQLRQTALSAEEIRSTQAELRESNEMLEAVIRCSPLAVVVMDIEGRVTLWNPAAERMNGCTREEVLGRRLPVILPNNDPDEVPRVHNRIMNEGGVTGLEYVCLTKGGTPKTVSVSGAPLHNAAGQRNGAVYLVMDITEQKSLERQLAQAQKLESIGQLAAGIAHEINTPIQYVGDNLRFLQTSVESLIEFWTARADTVQKLLQATGPSGPPGGIGAELELHDADVEYLCEEMPRAIAQSLEGTDQIARIVGALKEFSHYGPAGKAAVDINQAIRSTILVSGTEWKYVADVITDFDPELPPVQCIPGEINQVVLNLIVNAAHAVGDVVQQQSGAKGTITVSTRRAGDWAEIRVRDTGTGIPEAVRGSIFNPFFTTKAVGKGTGQGLAIAYAVVVRRHGGSITFETEVGAGTTFVVRLPMGTPDESSSEADREASRPTTAQTRHTQPSTTDAPAATGTLVH